MHQPRKLNELSGYQLRTIDGDDAKMTQIYFDDQHWTVRYFIVHTQSMQSGQGVLVVPSVIKKIDEENKTVEMDVTMDQINQCPSANTVLPVSHHYKQESGHYQGWTPYWVADPIFGAVPLNPPHTPEEDFKVPEQQQLRSSNEVIGYLIQAEDGEIGQVEDFIVEDPDWKIRYLEINTSNWLLGKKVLIAPTWIQQVSWTDKQVMINLSREAIQSAPAYDPSKLISRDYQLKLYKYYGKKFHQD
ncbi:MAG: PRC-barrel domain-containing protein [SAR324 cluster bacterium]|nr:PRC-barrel domain-containing protein [SAR324 cluster bacterium]